MINVTKEEFDTILAALEFLMDNGGSDLLTRLRDLRPIATNGGKHEVMTNEQIEAMIERINCERALRHPKDVVADISRLMRHGNGRLMEPGDRGVDVYVADDDAPYYWISFTQEQEAK